MHLAMKACELAQRYGVDMVSSAGVMAFAIELFQQDIITREDFGYAISFGDDEGIFRLLQDIVERRGLGTILAEGTARAAAYFKDAEILTIMRVCKCNWLSIRLKT